MLQFLRIQNKLIEQSAKEYFNSIETASANGFAWDEVTETARIAIENAIAQDLTDPKQIKLAIKSAMKDLRDTRGSQKSAWQEILAVCSKPGQRSLGVEAKDVHSLGVSFAEIREKRQA